MITHLLATCRLGTDQAQFLVHCWRNCAEPGLAIFSDDRVNSTEQYRIYVETVKEVSLRYATGNDVVWYYTCHGMVGCWVTPNFCHSPHGSRIKSTFGVNLPRPHLVASSEGQTLRFGDAPNYYKTYPEMYCLDHGHLLCIGSSDRRLSVRALTNNLVKALRWTTEKWRKRYDVEGTSNEIM